MPDRELCELQEEIETLRAELAALNRDSTIRPHGVLRRLLADPRVRIALAAAVVAIPLAAFAATVSMPYTFTNGTVADANEVNANFDTLVIESNSQDARIDSLESSVVHTHPGSDITSQVGDADTVDGVHASDLEESAEIIANVGVHAADASAHHARYADGEAQTAMGAKQNTNPLNHDRYTDAEALSAAAGVDAGTLDGLDSTDFSGASHTHTYGKVAIVAQSGGAYTNPKAAMDDRATWCGTPGAANPCLVRIMPGVYDLGNNALTMRSYVDVEGSGENTTVVTSTHSSGMGDAASATVVGAGNAEIRFLTIDNQGGSSYAIALHNDSASPKITNITATASGGTYNRGVSNYSSSPTMTNVTATASGGTTSNGMLNVSSSPTLMNVTATASGGTNNNHGVRNDSSSPTMTNVTATASGGSYNYGVSNSGSSSPTMTNVTATASGGSYSYGLSNSASSPTMTNVTATASGGSNNFGVNNSFSSFPTMQKCTISGTTNSIRNNDPSIAKVGTTMLDGSVTGTGLFTCVGAYDASFVALSTGCL